jgi:hypothetical protein
MRCLGDNHLGLLGLDQNTTLQHIALNSKKLETPRKKWMQKKNGQKIVLQHEDVVQPTMVSTKRLGDSQI